MLRDGYLVAFPTETVYGLGGVASDPAAVARIYAAKMRPAHNPLIIHVPSIEAAERVGEFVGVPAALLERFWPGPLTLVVPLRLGSGLAVAATAGLDTVALRVPAHPVARDLLEAVNMPVAAPSANPSGRVSATSAAHVACDLGRAVAFVIDAGPSPIGLESTVLDLVDSDRPRLLRAGAVPTEMLADALGQPLAEEEGNARPRSPGQLASHYAPDRPVRLEAVSVEADEALLAFGPVPLKGAAIMRNLSSNGDLAEAGYNLYAFLRQLDRADVSRIAVMPLPRTGLGAAINDRLRRAAAPRPPSAGHQSAQNGLLPSR